jgi:hypothetical protein
MVERYCRYCLLSVLKTQDQEIEYMVVVVVVAVLGYTFGHSHEFCLGYKIGCRVEWTSIS